MHLWILAPLNEDDGPWNPWYEKCFGMIVRARNAEYARELASREALEEGTDVWLDASLTRCEILRTDGDEKVIITDERWA